MRDVLDKSRNHRDQLLHNLSAQLPAWRAKVMHEKAIYDTMNRFNYNVGRKCLVAVGWCPIARTDDVRAALRRGSDRSGALTQSILSVVRTNEVPPTYFELNKVTSAFHAIVEAYGVASYREINPTPLTVVTFPFLFAIMFGDFGHGILMALFALGLILIEKRVDERSLDEIGGMIFSRALHAVRDGRVLDVRRSALQRGVRRRPRLLWRQPLEGVELAARGQHDSYQWCENSGVYPFGVDPQWKGVPNEITFYNSIKMKVSIVFGVVHMTIGIVFSMLNSIHFKKWYDLLFVNLPSLIFFVSMFGYLAFVIIFKWITVRSNAENLPKLMNIMIDMFLAPFSCCGNPDEPFINGQYNKYLDDRLYDGQPVVQGILFVLVVACVPVLLCGKPCMLWRDHRKRMKGKAGYEKLHAGSVPDTASSQDDAPKSALPEVAAVVNRVAIDDNAPHDAHGAAPAAGHGGDGHGGGHGGHGDHFELSEVFMHQIIHAIEFILGAISNTASYLRLWALSLAHAELAIVFWERAFSLNLGGGGEEATAAHTATNSTVTLTTMTGNVTTAVSTLAATTIAATTEMGAAAEHAKQSVGTTTLYAFVGFSAWFGASLGVLMVMEALSAFLHALRLHWVEFQNKFLQGTGVKFAPFSFQALEDLAMAQQQDESNN
jgi:V-type H+-transporting ATPase subunit a